MNPIFKRKSTRNYSDDEVSTDKIKNLIRAGMQAPSAFNSQPWEFIIVSDKEDLKAAKKNLCQLKEILGEGHPKVTWAEATLELEELPLGD